MEFELLNLETRRRFTKIEPSYYRAQKFMERAKRSKKIAIISYRKL